MGVRFTNWRYTGCRKGKVSVKSPTSQWQDRKIQSLCTLPLVNSPWVRGKHKKYNLACGTSFVCWVTLGQVMLPLRASKYSFRRLRSLLELTTCFWEKKKLNARNMFVASRKIPA
jgi:hypothetical protein